MRTRLILRALIPPLLILSLSGVCYSAQFPKPVGYVNDFAGMISPEAEQVIEAIAREVKAKTGAEIAILTIDTTGDIDPEEYAVEVFMDWGIGERGKDNGILILVAKNDRQIRIKPGYGIEGIIPDATAFRIYRDVLRPAFRAGRFDEGLVSATEMIANLILRESGETLAESDSLLRTYAARHAAPPGVSRRMTLILFLLAMIFIPGLLVLMLALRTGGGYYARRGGFWIGGFGGGGTIGGFGGGFGGFGGGSCGGGGAGGGW